MWLFGPRVTYSAAESTKKVFDASPSFRVDDRFPLAVTTKAKETAVATTDQLSEKGKENKECKGPADKKLSSRVNVTRDIEQVPKGITKEVPENCGKTKLAGWKLPNRLLEVLFPPLLIQKHEVSFISLLLGEQSVMQVTMILQLVMYSPYSGQLKILELYSPPFFGYWVATEALMYLAWKVCF